VQWGSAVGEEQEEGTVMDDLWIRYFRSESDCFLSHRLIGRYDSRRVRCLERPAYHHFRQEDWLAQANHILTRLDATSRFEDYRKSLPEFGASIFINPMSSSGVHGQVPPAVFTQQIQ
jgi:hypothetical protein